MTQTQLDILFYIILALALLKSIDILNKVARYLSKGNKKIYSHAERISNEAIEKKKSQKTLAKSTSQDKVEPKITQVALVQPEDVLDFDGQPWDDFNDIDHDLVETLQQQWKSSALVEDAPLPVQPDLRIRDLAKPDNKVFNKRKKPMAVRIDSTRIVNIPDLLTDEAIRMLDKPAFERYPQARFASSKRTSNIKQRTNRREAITAFLDILPRAAAM